MKRILILSLVVNFALIGLVAWRRPEQAAMPAREVRSKSSAQGEVRSRPVRPVGPTTSATTWSKIESRDIQQFIANLRASGCPEATIRDIVTFRICRSYRARLLEAQAEMYGQLTDSQSLSQADWEKIRELNQDLRDGMHDELESALGEDWATLAGEMTGFPLTKDGFNKTLTAEQHHQLREIKKQFRSKLQELEYKQMVGGLEKDEIATFRNLEREQRAALAAVLSPAQLEEYLYRNSSAADYVRRTLPAAKSESEYRTMVKLALEMEMSPTLDSPLEPFGIVVEDEIKQGIQQRKKDYADRLKESLGDDRIAEQEQETQARKEAEAEASAKESKARMQQELTDTAVAAGVSAENAGRFYDRLKESESVMRKKFEELEKSLSGTPEEKQEQMKTAVKAELNRMAVETMGDKGPDVVDKLFDKK